MRTIEYWTHRYDAALETVPQLIAIIQRDAMIAASEIAERQAVDDATAADSAADMTERLTYLAQKERALAIQKALLVEAQIPN